MGSGLLWRGRAGRVGLFCIAVAGLLGCAATVQKTAKEAAPAAVEGAVEEARKPDTRADIAAILQDPEIRSAASALTAAILAGAMDGLADDARSAQLQHLTDAVVRSMGASFANSLRQDIGPQLSQTLAEAVNHSLEQALNEDTQQRLSALTGAVTRGLMDGVHQGLVDATGQPSQAYRTLLGQAARDVTEQAALGLDDAVRRASDEDGSEAPVLAALGTLSALTRALPLLIIAGFVMFAALCVAPAVWLWTRVQHHRRESLAHQEAALALARAIKTTEPLSWSDELRDHLARETRDATELRHLLREHAELRLRPNAGPPASERHV